MPLLTKISGVWKYIVKIYTNVGGVWKVGALMKTNVAAVWKDAFPMTLTTYTWTGDGDGTDWSDGDNWDLDDYPKTPEHKAYFPFGGAAANAVILDTEAIINGGIGEVNIHVGGGNLTLNKDLRVTGDIKIGNGLGGNSGKIDVNGKTLQCDGDLLMYLGGTLDLGGATGLLKLAGDFHCYGGGIFTHSDGTLEMIDAFVVSQIIHEATTFKDFKCAAPGKELQFQTGVNLTITGSFTIQGASGNEIKLLSMSSPTQWGIDNQGNAEDVDYAYVKDSSPVLSNDITADNSTNGDNNDVTPPGWIFS